MTKQSIHIGDNEVLDAALESVTAEVQSKPKKDAPADKKVADLEQQVREANDRALRSHAELENFRKRSQRELVDERKFAIVPFAKDLLSVVDNLERAIEAANNQIARLSETQTQSVSEGATSNDITHLLDGVKLVATQLETILKEHGAVRIDTVGTPFDPNFHQAIAQEASDEHPAGTITRAFQAGYKLHDRVIRPAQVFVSTGPTNK
ncbi:MAG TPA: nucleotide exchange factor GrpE [Pirellulaceae bacterium]|jgi:molecular chaperone GrpE